MKLTLVTVPGYGFFLNILFLCKYSCKTRSNEKKQVDDIIS